MRRCLCAWREASLHQWRIAALVYDALLSRIVSAFDPRRARFVRRRAYVASCARAGDVVKRRTCRM